MSDHLGPAMQALNEGQRNFVIALLETGAKDNTLAAEMAGYSGTQGSRKVQAYRLIHNPKVLAAIREEGERRLRSGAILGASVLIEIASDTMHKDRFKAAVELLNRSGLLVETQHRVIVENDTRSAEQIRSEVVELFKRLNPGQPPPLALAKPIDVEYAEVSDPDDISDLIG